MLTQVTTSKSDAKTRQSLFCWSISVRLDAPVRIISLNYLSM